MRCLKFTPLFLAALIAAAPARAQSSNAKAGFRGIEVVEPIMNAGGEPVEIVVGVGHKETVNGLAFSPDGKTMLSGSKDGTLKLWDAASGRLIRKFVGHSSEINSVAFSPDGDKVLSGSSDKSSILWDTKSGRRINTFPGHTIVSAVTFSPDGRRALAGDYDGTLDLFDINSGKTVRTFSSKTSIVYAVAFSPDGETLLSAGMDFTVRLWDLTGQNIRTFSGGYTGETDGIKAAVFSPDGLTMASGGGHNVVVWDIAKGIIVQTLKHAMHVRSLSFSPDGGKLLSGSNHQYSMLQDGYPVPSGPKGITLWDVSSGKPIRSFDQHSDRGWRLNPSAVAYSRNGRVIGVGRENGSLQLFDIQSGQQLWSSRTSESIALAVSPNSEVVGTSLTTIWDIASGQQIKKIAERPKRPSVLAFSPDGKHIVSGGTERPLALYEFPSGRLLRQYELDDPEFQIYSAAFSSDGKTIAALEYGKVSKEITVLDTFSGAIRHQLDAGWRHTHLALSADGRRLLSGELGGRPSERQKINLSDVSSERYLKTISRNPSDASNFVFSLDGKTLFTSIDRTIKKISVETGKAVLNFNGRAGDVNWLELSRDGRSILSGSDDGTLKIWNASTGQLRQSFDTHAGPVSLVGFSARGRILSLTGDGVLQVRHQDTGELLANLVSFPNDEWVAITPEGFFDASENGAKLLTVVRGLEVYSADQFYEKLYSPYLVQQKLAGDPQGKVRAAAAGLNLTKAATSGAPPRIRIVSPTAPASVSDDYAEVEVEIVNQGGGIGKVEWRVNDQLFGADPAGSVGINGNAAVQMSRRLPLGPGDNRIDVLAYNARDIIESDRARIVIRSSQNQAAAAARLFILAIGVNDYASLRPRLTFARPDAEAVRDGLRRAGQKLYEVVDVPLILDKDVTAAKLEATFSELSRRVRPQDILVVFMAGHGKTVDGLFYLLPQDFNYRDKNSIVVRGIGQDKFMLWLSQIHALRSVLLIDACESGSAIQEWKDALNLMNRASNRTIITATTDDKPAAEGYRGHGVFTYSLLSALGEADADDDGTIDLLQIMRYVGKTLPKLADDEWKIDQRPLFNFKGENFKLVAKTSVLQTRGRDVR